MNATSKGHFEGGLQTLRRILCTECVLPARRGEISKRGGDCEGPAKLRGKFRGLAISVVTQAGDTSGARDVPSFVRDGSSIADAEIGDLVSRIGARKEGFLSGSD